MGSLVEPGLSNSTVNSTGFGVSKSSNAIELPTFPSAEKALELLTKKAETSATSSLVNIDNTPNNWSKQTKAPEEILKSRIIPEGHYLIPYILEASQTHGIDPFLIASVIQQESGFIPKYVLGKEVSSAKAIGAMQLLAGTAADMGCNNPKDPKQNILAGTKYLKWMLKKYNNNTELALAAYNAGFGNVKSSIPQNGETPKYVANIMRDYNRYLKEAEPVV